MCHGWLYSNGLCLNYVFLKKKIKIMKEAPEVVNSIPIWAYRNDLQEPQKNLSKMIIT